MPGGVAVLDYDGDGRLDVFFTNGASVPGLAKDAPRYSNRLFHNEGGGRFADTTAAAGLRGEGYAVAAAVADYDNDGDPDLFVGGVKRQQLFRNSGGASRTWPPRRASRAASGWSAGVSSTSTTTAGSTSCWSTTRSGRPRRTASAETRSAGSASTATPSTSRRSRSRSTGTAATAASRT
jgi:hypothetical protein